MRQHIHNQKILPSNYLMGGYVSQEGVGGEGGGDTKESHTFSKINQVLTKLWLPMLGGQI